MASIHEKLRNKLASTGVQLFSLPYLSFGMTWAAFLIAFADMAAVLLNQPGLFWLDVTRAQSSIPFLQTILTKGFIFYGVISVLYLALYWILLKTMTRSVSIVLWICGTFLHTNHFLLWLIHKVVGLKTTQLLDNLISIFLVAILLTFLLLQKKKRELKRWDKIVLWLFSGVWVCLFVGLLIYRGAVYKPGWQQLDPQHSPGRRMNAALAYDIKRQEAVLFGGADAWMGSSLKFNNDTWIWNGEDWHEVYVDISPAMRVNHVMAYDEKNEVVVMFGGEDVSGYWALDDTWLWDGETWSQVFPEHSPCARDFGEMFYDREMEVVVLVGGFAYNYPEEGTTRMTDTWLWDGEDWMNYYPDTPVPHTFSPTNAYDPIRGRGVVYNYHDLLIWKQGDWSRIAPDFLPPVRFTPEMAVDPNTGKILMFGGQHDDQFRNDSWILDGDVWQELSTDVSPPERESHLMFYDYVRNSFVIYGGGNKTGLLDDMWELVLP